MKGINLGDKDVLIDWSEFNLDYGLLFRVMAHESGHSFFNLQHPFLEFCSSDPGSCQSKFCINVMDYCEEKWLKTTKNKNRKLFKYQWDKIHSVTN